MNDQRAGRTVPHRRSLFVVGVAVIGLSFAQIRGGDPLSTAGLTVGALMVCLASLSEQILRIKARAGGVDVEMKADVAASTSALADAPPTDRVVKESETLAGASYLLASLAIEAIFTKNDLLKNCKFHLYLPDEDGRLAAVLEPDDEDDNLDSWRAGQGAVGRAWSDDEFVLVTGNECHDGTYNLTSGQQERYRDLTAIAARPIRNAHGLTIGIVSAATSTGDSALVGTDGFIEMALVAELLARILIDTLKWYTDG